VPSDEHALQLSVAQASHVVTLLSVFTVNPALQAVHTPGVAVLHVAQFVVVHTAQVVHVTSLHVYPSLHVVHAAAAAHDPQLAGHASQEPVVNGDVVLAAMVPAKPALHAQPDAALAPIEFAGHATAWQEPVKNGDAVLAAMVPVKPALQVQPFAKCRAPAAPFEFVGQFSAWQEPLKNGDVVLAAMVPLKPARQVQPAATSVPVEFPGHETASQRLLVKLSPALHPVQMPTLSAEHVLHMEIEQLTQSVAELWSVATVNPSLHTPHVPAALLHVLQFVS
jgi:hypothetical protein